MPTCMLMPTLPIVPPLQAGGLSGRPLFEMATQVLREMYTLTGAV